VKVLIYGELIFIYKLSYICHKLKLTCGNPLGIDIKHLELDVLVFSHCAWNLMKW